MTIYVDNARIPFRNMIMSHLMSDDIDELHEFAARLGMKRAWFQDTSIPHYDVSEGMRQKAIRMGAVQEDAFHNSDNLKAVKRAHRARGRHIVQRKVPR